MTIAITAASGHLGSAIVKALLKDHAPSELIALARTPKHAEHLGVEVREGDYNNVEQLERALDGVDTVLLVSGMDEPSQRIGQHRNVINAAKKKGVKKIVYTSIQGAEQDTDFSPIVQSNRQTEQDLRESGLDWVIGRNGIYIEPDIEYIEHYKNAGTIANCAGDGLCPYTTRDELAYAYAQMLRQDKHNGQTYNLHGTAISQQQLADYINQAFGTQLTFTDMSVADYRRERQEALGDFIGTVIAGIYQGIREGKANHPSHFAQASGRAHQSWEDYFAQIKANAN